MRFDPVLEDGPVPLSERSVERGGRLVRVLAPEAWTTVRVEAWILSLIHI